MQVRGAGPPPCPSGSLAADLGGVDAVLGGFLQACVLMALKRGLAGGIRAAGEWVS